LVGEWCRVCHRWSGTQEVSHFPSLCVWTPHTKICQTLKTSIFWRTENVTGNWKHEQKQIPKKQVKTRHVWHSSRTCRIFGLFAVKLFTGPIIHTRHICGFKKPFFVKYSFRRVRQNSHPLRNRNEISRSPFTGGGLIYRVLSYFTLPLMAPLVAKIRRTMAQWPKEIDSPSKKCTGWPQYIEDSKPGILPGASQPLLPSPGVRLQSKKLHF